MKTVVCLTAIFLLMASGAIAQQKIPAVEAALLHPKAKEEAAKADQRFSTTTVFDSSCLVKAKSPRRTKLANSKKQ